MTAEIVRLRIARSPLLLHHFELCYFARQMQRCFGLTLVLGLFGCNVGRALPFQDPNGDQPHDAGVVAVDGGHDLAHDPDLAVGARPADLSFTAPDLSRLPDLSQPPDMTLPQPSSAPCLSGGNVLYLNGSGGDFVHPGNETLYGGDWWSSLSPSSSQTIDYSWGNNTGVTWSFAFSSRMLSAPLTIGHYDGAERYPFEEAGHPGMSIYGDGRGCNNDYGWFDIESVAWTAAGGYSEFTVVFEQYCDTFTVPLIGCAHFEGP